MSGGGGTTSTTTSNNAPPQQFLDAFTNVNNQAQNVAQTPYQSYQGNTIAPFAPGQVQGMQQVQDLTANGGVQAPYLDAATRSLLNAQTPLIQNIPTLSDPVLQGQAYNAIQNFAGAAGPDIQNAASQGAQNIMNASKAFNPNSIQPWESPYTQDVVNATQNQFNNANAIQQQQVIGDAIGKGAWGGDRSAVAQALTAGQQQLAQAPVIAGLYNTGYQNATQAAQTAANMGLQGSTSAGSLGLQGAAQQAAARQAAGQAQQGIFSGQQQTELGANEANAWLASQAGALFGNLGQEAQTLGLQGANANLGIGGMQQGMGQSLLNVPYEQNLAAQAYPFQTTGWLANIAEGLGGASGGNSSTTVPGPSTASQVAGLGLGAAGVAGQAGAFKGLGNSISNAFSSGANSVPAAGTDAYAAYLNSGAARGGTVPQRAPGGSVPDVSLSVIPQATGLGASPIVAPMSPDAIVPGASGMGAAPKTHGTMDILKNYGQTASTVGPKQDSTFGSLLKTAGAIAAGIYGGPAGGMAASELNKQYTLATGGTVPKRASGGMSPSMESPWWERSAASNMTRHGLLSSPVAGRTDQLAISPAAGSYVVPADVVSGLGEGNTLAGANIMQRILDTGPHGLKMPVSSHNHMGPPRPPPAYNEGTEHISNTSHYVPNAKGGSVGRASGGAANDNPKYSREELLGSGLSRVIDNAGDDQDLADIKHSVLHHGLHVPASLFDVPDRASGGMIPRRAVGGYTSLQDFINRGSSNNDSGRAPAQINFENQGVGINASTGTGGSHTGMPALDNYLNNVETGANFTRPTTGAPAAAPAAPGPTTPPATTKGPPNGNFETNAYSNASPFLQAFANDLASNPQANPQYKTFFADQTNNGGGGMASGGMVPRRADGGSADEIDLDVDSTPIDMTPPQPGPSIPGGLYASSASAAPVGMTPAFHEQMAQHAPGTRQGSYVPPPPEYAAMVQEAAARHGVDPKPLAWLLSTESHWNPKAYNPLSHTMGLGQFKAATAREVGIDPWIPAQAIDGSAAYLRQMLNKHGDYEHAIARYGTFSTGHGPEADAAVRNQYRAFMQGAKRGGMVKFADGGAPSGDYLGSAVDDPDYNFGIISNLPVGQRLGKALPHPHALPPDPSMKWDAPVSPSGHLDWSRPLLQQLPSFDWRGPARQAADRAQAQAMPDTVPAGLFPVSSRVQPTVARNSAPSTMRSDAATTRSPQLEVNPEGGPTTVVVKDKGPPPPPPVVATTSQSPAGASESSAPITPPTHAHETPTDETYTDPHGLKVSPWEALTTAGFAMAAGKSPHALENIGAGGLAGMNSYQKQRQLAIQDQMRIDQAKTNALWRQNQDANAKDRNLAYAQRVADQGAQGQQRVDAYGRRIDSLADQGQQRIDQLANMNAAKQSHMQWLEQHGDATLAQQKAHLEATMNHWNVGDVYRAMSIGKDPLGMKPPPSAEQAAATNTRVHSLANPAAPATAPALLPLPATKAALVPGKAYNTGRGPATWDGSQFLPMSP